MSRTQHITALCLAGALCLLGSVALAQTNAEINAGIQFNFSTPGARSLGLGGAFLGLADDATAAYTNPAGLTALSRPEVSIEGRRWKYTNIFTDGGRAYGEPSGEGIDTVAGLIEGEESSTVNGLSFLSFVYPKNTWAFAIYRHELANFETQYDTSGALFEFFDAGSPLTSRFFPAIAAMDLEIVNYGISGAFKMGDNFTLGLGASYYDFQMESSVLRYNACWDGVGTACDELAPGGFYGTPLYDAANLVNFQDQVGDDTDTAFNVGFLWKLGPKVSMGGVYRQGPSFEVDATNTSATGTVFFAGAADFNVPDVYGIGFAIKATDAATIALDWDRVNYSDMTKDVVNVFGTEQDAATERLTVDDANELHLGFEYVFVNAKYPVALRFGSWYDPDHKVYFDGEPNDGNQERTLAALFRQGDDEFHYAAGLGFIFGQKFQLDLAADMSDLIDTYSLSGVFRF